MTSSENSSVPRPLVAAARYRAVSTGLPGAALELTDGTIISGKTTDAMNTVATTVLKALRHLGGLDKSQHIVPDSAVDPILELKREYLGMGDSRLNVREALIALAQVAASDEGRRNALEQLPTLRDCPIYTTEALNHADKKTLTSLGLNVVAE